MNYTEHFEMKMRADASQFVAAKEGAPQELRDLISDIHMLYFFNTLPNDWIYQTILEAFEYCADETLGSVDDISVEADLYNSDLASWFYENCNQFAHEYCNQAMEELAVKDIILVMSAAQWNAKDKIYRHVYAWLQDGEGQND